MVTIFLLITGYRPWSNHAPHLSAGVSWKSWFRRHPRPGQYSKYTNNDDRGILICDTIHPTGDFTL